MNTPNDMNKSNHTALTIEDYGFSIEENKRSYEYAIAQGDQHICYAWSGLAAGEDINVENITRIANEAKERAALIVHRVNNWDKLVEALEELVTLKNIKDIYGQTPDYLERQPKAWEAPKQALDKKEV